jgi:hypothetical protein
VSGKRVFRLAHQTARNLAIECIATAPDGYLVEVREPTRTSDQNAKLHACLNDISKQIKWHGESMDIEVWKRLLTAAWARAEREPVKLVPSLDGQGFDVIYRRTSKMSKSEMISMIEYILAWGTDQGVKWSDEYRWAA